jgi:hypothetical protein
LAVTPGSLPQFDTVTPLNLLPEPVIAYGMAILACLLDEMHILTGDLILEQLPIRMLAILGIFTQTKVFIMLAQAALNAPSINP